jgi:hypothetical protein
VDSLCVTFTNDDNDEPVYQKVNKSLIKRVAGMEWLLNWYSFHLVEAVIEHH